MPKKKFKFTNRIKKQVKEELVAAGATAPAAVLEVAKNKTSALHRFFKWDNA